MPIVWTSGSLKLLEPSGPVQVSNGIILLFHCENLDVRDKISSSMGVADEVSFRWLRSVVKWIKVSVIAGHCKGD